MKTYEKPTISTLGSVADFTRGEGSGSQSDYAYDVIEGWITGTIEWGTS